MKKIALVRAVTFGSIVALIAPDASAQQFTPRQVQRLPPQQRLNPTRPNRFPSEINPQINPNVTVRQRPRPELDPLGVRLGSYLLYPRVSLSEEFDTNVNASNDDEESDFVTRITPQVDLLSNFSRHQLNFRGGYEAGIFKSEDQNNYQDFFGQTDGRLDITRQVRLEGRARYSRTHEERDDFDAETAEVDEDIVPINEYLGTLFLRQQFNRLFYRVGGTAGRRAYEDEGDINNADRDRNRVEPALRVGYELGPRWDVFVEGSYFDVSHDTDTDANGNERDFDGYRIGAGADVDLTSILFGEVFLGYETSDFEDDDFDDISGPSFGAGLTWNVTRLTTVSLDASRRIESTRRGGSAGVFNSVVDLGVDHELLRNLILGGRLGYENDDFEDGTENTFLAGAGVDYILNRNFVLNFDYTFATRDGDEPDRDYNRHRFLLGLTARL